MALNYIDLQENLESYIQDIDQEIRARDKELEQYANRTLSPAEKEVKAAIIARANALTEVKYKLLDILAKKIATKARKER